MELSKELKSEIDFMLIELMKGNYFSDNKKNSDLQDQSIRICKAMNLIKLSISGKQYELASEGVLVFNDGGIDKYLINVKNEKDLNTTIKQLTHKKLEYEQFPAKFWWLIIIITAFVSILTNWAINQMQI